MLVREINKQTREIYLVQNEAIEISHLMHEEEEIYILYTYFINNLYNFYQKYITSNPYGE